MHERKYITTLKPCQEKLLPLFWVRHTKIKIRENWDCWVTCYIPQPDPSQPMPLFCFVLQHSRLFFPSLKNFMMFMTELDEFMLNCYQEGLPALQEAQTIWENLAQSYNSSSIKSP